MCLDDWDVTKEEALTEVMSWMGDLGGTKWFPGYLPVTSMKPCSKWAMVKMIKNVMSFSDKMVHNFKIKRFFVGEKCQVLGRNIQ